MELSGSPAGDTVHALEQQITLLVAVGGSHVQAMMGGADGRILRERTSTALVAATADALQEACASGVPLSLGAEEDAADVLRRWGAAERAQRSRCESSLRKDADRDEPCGTRSVVRSHVPINSPRYVVRSHVPVTTLPITTRREADLWTVLSHAGPSSLWARRQTTP